MSGYVYQGTHRLDDPMSATCYGALGTVRGYGRHSRRGERPCDACREAMNAYNRRRRVVWESNPATRAKDAQRRKARARAWSALAKRHAQEFEALVRAELARLIREEQAAS